MWLSFDDSPMPLFCTLIGTDPPDCGYAIRSGNRDFDDDTEYDKD